MTQHHLNYERLLKTRFTIKNVKVTKQTQSMIISVSIQFNFEHFYSVFNIFLDSC